MPIVIPLINLYLHQEFVSEEDAGEIVSQQQQIEEQDQHLCDIKERMREYELRMEECHRNLKAIKDHLQFNEKFTRKLIRENQMLQLKLMHKGQLFANSGISEDKQDEELRKELDALYLEQETCEIGYESVGNS